MTDHLSISKQLALTIGWREDQIIDYPGQEYIGLPVLIAGRPMVKFFDYRYEVIAFRVAQHYDCFPFKSEDVRTTGMWATFNIHTGVQSLADTPQLAIAMAVIEGAKK